MKNKKDTKDNISINWWMGCGLIVSCIVWFVIFMMLWVWYVRNIPGA